ncbi:Uncharacterized protein GBIM_04035 [Gryllus bimaculatus]|nr:Uncharacterized protein GBIM_04035 [Gryllus bimaculatus]
MAVIPNQDYWCALTARDFTVFSSGKVQMLLASEMDEKNAVKILKHLTQTVTQGVSEGFHYDDNVLVSVKHLLEYIKTQSSSVDSSILSCVYYVSKYFLKRGEVRMVLELKPFMKDLKMEITEDVLKVYYGFFYELFMFLKQRNKTLCMNTILKIRYDYLDVLSCCNIKYLDVLLLEANHFVYGEETINQAQCLEYGIHFLKVAKCIIRECTVVENCEKICGNYTRFVTSLLNNILVSKNGGLLAEVLNDVEVFETSDESYNKIISFFVRGVKAILDANLPVDMIQQQTSALQHLIQEESVSVLILHLHRFASVLTSAQGYWLSSRTEALSVEEFMTISELAILLSSYLKDYIQNKQPAIEPAFVASLSLKVIVNIISLGINIILGVNNIKDKEPSADVYKVLKQLSAVQAYSYELLAVIHSIDDNIWKNLWKMLAVKSVKLASVLEYRGCIKHASEFYEQFWCGFFALEPLLDIQEGIITPEDCVYNALKGHTQCLIHQSKYEEALISIGITVLLSPNYCAGLQRTWVSTKQASLSKKNINLQNFLITNIFIEQKLTMAFPNAFAKLCVKNDSDTSFRLLYWELSSYTLNRSEMHDAICNVGTQLMDSQVDPVCYVEGITLFLSNTWMKYDVLATQFSVAYEKAVMLGQLKLKKISKNHKWYLLTLLGNLNYYSFFAQITALRKKLQNDVADKKDMFCSKVNRNLMKGFIDPSEAEMKSNIFTTYSDLNVEKEQQILDKLVQALESWRSVTKCEEMEIQPLQNKYDDLLINVKTTAQAFALYGYPVYSLRAWVIYYKLCKHSGLCAASLYGLSQLLKFSCNTDDFKLWKEADKLEDQVQKNIDSKGKEMLFSYYLTKSRCCLLNNEYDIGWQYLQKVNESSNSSSFGLQLIFAQKYLLVSKYYTHQVDFKELPEKFEDSNAFVATIKALKILKTLYTIGKIESLFENCSLHLMMMEAAEWTANLCLGMKLYRDGYAHLKTYLTCAQILGLASRCSLLVSKLAQFDLLCQELENAEVKVYGLEAILCLRKTCPSIDKIEKQPSCEKLKEISDTLSLDSEIARMKLLDVPSPVPTNLMGSPELVKSPFKMPFILRHKGNCKCLYCHSLLLQTSLAELALIKAQLHVLKGENNLALSYFKGGMNLCERLKDMQEKIVNNLSVTILGKVSNSYFSLSDPFLSAHSKLSLAYGEFLFLTRHYELVQHMTTYSLESLLQSQECNLHVALDMIDKTQVLFNEMNKTPNDQLDTDDEKENQALNGDPDSLSPKIMKTPKSYRDCLVNAPGLNRNEDHLHLSKALSPSVVLKLDAKLKSAETENGQKNLRNKGRKKIVACINFNDSSVNDCILETVEKGNSFESGSNLNFSPSSNQLCPQKEQEIEIISERIENIAICTSQDSAHKTQNAGRGSSKTFSINFSEERETSHSTRNLKSKHSKKLNHISELENNDCNLLPKTNRKHFKSPLMDTSERNGSSNTELSPVTYKSLKPVNNSKMKGESTNEMSNDKAKGKTKPKVIIYTDSSDAEFVSPDTSVIPSQNTLKDLNLQSECEVTSEREEKMVTPRKTRYRSTKENSLMGDNTAKNTQKSSQKKISKVTKNSRKVPVITQKSESDNSPEDVCIKVHNGNCLPLDEDELTRSSSPECIFISPERKPALRKYERRIAVPLETADSKHTSADDKTVTYSSVKKGVTRKKRNPYVL